MKHLLVNISVASLSLFMVLGLIEVGYRFLYNDGALPLRWNDRPEFYYKSEASNSFQDFKYEKPKPSDVFRVAVIGDSFTYAPFMQFDDAYPKRLERMLNLHDLKKYKLKTEVVNYGQRGASTMTETPMLEKALKAEPDLVVLQITLNDPAMLTYRETVKKFPGAYTFGKLPVSKDSNELYHYWKSLGFIASRIHNKKTQESYIEYHKDLFNKEPTWGYFSKAIQDMSAMTKEQGVNFIAVIFPMFDFSFDETYPFLEEHEKISKLLVSFDIPTLDLFTAFENVPSQRLQVKPGEDSHPNEIAHRIAAERIYKWLETSDFLPNEVILRDKYKRRKDVRRDKIAFESVL